MQLVQLMSCGLGFLRALERRLNSRESKPKGDGKPSGRSNLRRSEEDAWAEAGLYDAFAPGSSAAPSKEIAEDKKKE
jgi:hypothetical protein